jgi:hypothetical protein
VTVADNESADGRQLSSRRKRRSGTVFSDNCNNNLNVTFEHASLPVSGNEISKTRRTRTATYASGNSVSCSQTITLIDTTLRG